MRHQYLCGRWEGLGNHLLGHGLLQPKHHQHLAGRGRCHETKQKTGESHKKCMSLSDTVRCRYNVVNFLQIPHTIHPNSSPIRARYGACFVGSNSDYILPQSLQWCLKYHAESDHYITALKCDLYHQIISSNAIDYLDESWSYMMKDLNYRKTSNIRRTLVGNKIVNNSDVVGASPVGAAPTTSSFST